MCVRVCVYVHTWRLQDATEDEAQPSRVHAHATTTQTIEETAPKRRDRTVRHGAVCLAQ